MSYNKYGVSPKSERTLSGIVFDSKLEMNRWCHLKVMEQSGYIRDLKRQVVFELQPSFIGFNGKKVKPIAYISDFAYMVGEFQTVEDTKGFVTQVARLKIKMLQYKYPLIRFYIIKSANDIGGLIL